MTAGSLAEGASNVVKCPTCDDPLERIKRSALMRAVIGSRRYYCRFCYREYFCVLGHLFQSRS